MNDATNLDAFIEKIKSHDFSKGTFCDYLFLAAIDIDKLKDFLKQHGLTACQGFNSHLLTVKKGSYLVGMATRSKWGAIEVKEIQVGNLIVTRSHSTNPGVAEVKLL
jgi:hypothetical protein